MKRIARLIRTYFTTTRTVTADTDSTDAAIIALIADGEV